MISVASVPIATTSSMSADEYFDIVDEDNKAIGERKHRKLVHQDGDWHRAVHVWIYVIDTGELLLQQRSEFKESWARLWDISVAGHITAGDQSLPTAVRETLEEVGIEFPKEAFELLFTFKQRSTDHGGKFVNNEFDDVYLITMKERIPVEAFILDEAEVEAVKYMPLATLAEAYRRGDPTLVPLDMDSDYRQLFDILEGRRRRKAIVGSGSATFFHKKRGHMPVQIQCFTFDETYLKLIPAASR
eukprot:jgi/Ulvmu1/12670/UM094_0026.1